MHEDKVIGPAGREMGIQSNLIIPIRTEDNILGTLDISSNSKNSFNEEGLNVFEIVAEQIAIAINNAKQAEILRESEKALKEKGLD